MPSIHDTAYPRLKSNPNPEELTAIYTPTSEEITFADQTTRSKVTHLSFVILLKTFQRLGYAVMVSRIPTSIIRRIATTLQQSISSQELSEYDSSITLKRHLAAIREYLGLQAYDKVAQQTLQQVMETTTQSKHDLVDLINVAIEELIRQRFELLGFSTLERTAKAVRMKVTQAFYQRVTQALGQEEYIQLNRLFLTDEQNSCTPWNELKQDPGQPTLSRFQDLVERLKCLSALQAGCQAITELPDEKIKHFAAEAQVLEANQMKELRANKRYTLAVAFLSVQFSQTLDDIAEMFIKCMQKMHHCSKDALVQYRKDNQQRIDELLSTFRDVVLAYQIDGPVPERFAAIEQVIGDDGPELLEQCDAHLAFAGNNYFPFLPRFYRSHRAKLFRFLEAVPLHSSTQDKSLEQAIAFIQAHYKNRKTWLSTIRLENPNTTEAQQVQLLDLSWISRKWWFLVTGQRQRKPYPNQIHRQYFEICVFSHILLELQSGDLYIEGSSEFGDYCSQLISWEEYEANIAEYGELINLPIKAEAFVEHGQQWLEDIARQTDQAFPSNTKVGFKDDRLVIRRRKQRGSQGFSQLRSLIAERITPVSLLDSLTDTELWLNWTQFFKPVSGYEAKLDEPVARYLATTFCYGCNIGPTQLSCALRAFDRRQLFRVHQRHISTEKLQEAIDAVINAYNRFDLPRFWGSGKRAGTGLLMGETTKPPTRQEFMH